MAISLTGMILKGRYCILEQIGKGGEGRLYLARDLELGTVWAVKEIPIEQKREAKLLRLLEHPSLPRMVDYAEKEEFCYLVMEYIKGKSLGQWLREGRRFKVQEIAEFGVAAAQVLGYLHSRKPPVYYGDLKPDNLMLSQAGKLYLVDFGSAVLGYSGSQRICQGTKGYAAPEQYEGRMGRTSDVYALGKTLKALFGSGRPNRLYLAPGMAGVLWRCSRRKEKRRYQDMERVEQAFLRISRRASNGRQGIFGAAAAASVFLLAAGGFLLYQGKGTDFREALTQVTGRYHQKEFLKGNSREQAAICAEAEEELRKMLRIYEKKEEQRTLLLLLAVNGEYQGGEEHAALYYEQLLLYHPGFREAYGEYGLFLWRLGQKEESLRLWKDYRKKEQQGILEKGGSRNLPIWEERIHEWEEDKTQETDKMRRTDKTQETK